MNTIIIDFKDVQTHDEFYKEIISSFGFPNWCGDSPDAIRDLLAGYFEEQCKIIIKGTSLLPEELKNEFILIKKVFQDSEAWCKSIGKDISYIYE